MSTELKNKDITEKIIGASFEVHKHLGNGFPEIIYHRALAIEMKRAGLEYASEVHLPVYYKDVTDPIGSRRADFIVEGKVVVEIKAIIQLDDAHFAQALNYLKAYKHEVALLINFGGRSLVFKRIVR